MVEHLILVGSVFTIVGCILYIISMLMQRYYDRKLWELNEKFKQDEHFRKGYEKWKR